MNRSHENSRDPQSPGLPPGFVLTELRRLRSAEPESAGFAREIRTDREAESLAAWFDERGLLSRRETPARTDELSGGEHLVEIEETSALVFKATHPGKFGYGAGKELIHERGRSRKPPRITVGLTDATPSEYLARLEWQNELFGDSIEVLGMARHSDGLSILTVQPFVTGERTAQERIDGWFEAGGWQGIPRKDGAFYHAGRDLLILDALPRNVLTRPDGTLFPFDVVIVSPDADLKWSLELNRLPRPS